MPNIDHIREVREFIAREDDEHFDMATWATSLPGLDIGWPQVPVEDDGSVKFCGTVMCIAGTSVFLTDPKSNALKRNLMEVGSIAMDNMGLTVDEACGLFHKEYWPTKYQFELDDGLPQKEVALNILDRIIRTEDASFLTENV